MSEMGNTVISVILEDLIQAGLVHRPIVRNWEATPPSPLYFNKGPRRTGVIMAEVIASPHLPKRDDTPLHACFGGILVP